jgi:hypothetical protein
MPIGKTLEKKIQYRVKRQKKSVFMLKDFSDLSDKNQIMRALKKLIKKNLLVKIGQGLYARARISLLNNTPIPEKDITTLAIETMKKLKIKVSPSSYDLMYNTKESTQVPTGRVISVNSRISRKIGFNGVYISYAKTS